MSTIRRFSRPKLHPESLVALPDRTNLRPPPQTGNSIFKRKCLPSTWGVAIMGPHPATCWLTRMAMYFPVSRGHVFSRMLVTPCMAPIGMRILAPRWAMVASTCARKNPNGSSGGHIQFSTWRKAVSISVVGALLSGSFTAKSYANPKLVWKRPR